MREMINRWDSKSSSWPRAEGHSVFTPQVCVQDGEELPSPQDPRGGCECDPENRRV